MVLRDETFTETFEGAWDSVSGDAGAAALRSPFLGSDEYKSSALLIQQYKYGR